ncbi:prepilin-type N-terminal cleavage/methylation domain-containing protein [Desulfotomaculum arcticum]|uniref:Prepilin-type N-terminal cleavage/methylation domain-containing protein n=1 Tax=Desulfotruncus arcticus DSM 17038 TaxID=1121424 RepID=A0A1I2MNA9_9FIRM|nr:prepilin-type N-terminal cleavage/methylation domain-containing protein [Desulfotruncus arcticus]SFF92922.1 prepilin-type N-terminal cleavage/methylation domain-containing protein [Desulfotomaculum arcticum] [Desulfotruncus arcticus DSM 17038]
MNKFEVIKIQNKGFTIVELLIALALLVIVIALGYTFNFYVFRSFDIASKQSEVQQSVSLAKNIIENKVRYSQMDLLDELPEEIEPGYQAIYIESGVVKYIDEDGNTSDLLGAISGNVNMQVYFENKGDSFLRVYVQGDIDGDHEYNIDSNILIHKVTDRSDTIQGSDGTLIYFYVPPPPEEGT